jgi:glycosyltransferase involved in cell wall biosynthesis
VAVLSVIVPNFNHAKYLPDCLDSIVKQLYKPVEILIIDDASTDGSLEVISHYQQSYPGIRVVKNTKNEGVIPTVNKALELVSGNYVAFCAADDIFLPDFFSSQMAFFKQHPQLGLSCADACSFTDQKPYLFKKTSLDLGFESRVINPNELEQILWGKAFWIPSHATIYRTDLIKRYGKFDTKLKHLCDWFLNYQIAFRHPIGYIPKPFAAVRVVSQSYGATIRRDKKSQEEVFSYLLHLLSTSDLQNNFLKSGLLGQVGVSMIKYLATSPRDWRFFPRSLKKKADFFFKKIWQTPEVLLT